MRIEAIIEREEQQRLILINSQKMRTKADNFRYKVNGQA